MRKGMIMKEKIAFEVEILDNKSKEKWTWYVSYSSWGYVENFAKRWVWKLRELGALSDDYQFTITRNPIKRTITQL